MKKLIIICCMAIWGSPAHCQLFDRLFGSSDKFDFRLHAGLNLSNPEYNADHSQKTSFYAGFGGQYEFNSVAFTFGIAYADNGTKIKSGYLTDINTAQLNIPVTLKIYVAEPFYVEAGGYAGFVLAAEGKTTDGLTLDLPEFEDMDYGLIAGIGVDLDSFFIEAKYNFGLPYMIDMPAEFDPDFDPIVTDTHARIKDYKNRFVQIGVGFNF